ncbi:RipA family octameric membrane protein [Microbulbifer agarilyticus]|uniref:RipA family octameric membrane protein n=1 Tax=Microbulbifer agarilyticus TaxID=260552 RepID=UPI001C98CB83|nr:hypothetical protein [Microbulbifer agarilyticus]MBY6191196.1 hypothetical protein [Microbulbifer agarilyticus]MBY6211797.1 hypothetical protein [Microbulbifer agarilyticus]MCA0893178.1 hypothetical protein [Microbulbifer agarilyticus]
MNEQQYLCDHYRFNAEQRLKAFNFFVVLSMFADGGIFTAVEKGFHPLILVLLGGFVVIVSAVFWVMDMRSRQLLNLTVPGLRAIEAQLPEPARIFTRDLNNQGRCIRYTFAIRALILGQFICGTAVVVYGMLACFGVI